LSLNIEGFNHQTRTLSSHIEQETPKAVASSARQKPINFSHPICWFAFFI